MVLADDFTRRSVDVLCGLQESDGGILATYKSDAYPFVYPRDASFITMALNTHNLTERSKRFYRFIRGVRRPNGEILQRYNEALPYVTQKGEADVTPIVIQGVYDTFLASRDMEFLEEMWPTVEEGIGFVESCVDQESGLLRTTRSIHENRRLEEGFEIWANCAAVKGFLDASRIAGLVNHKEQERAWLQRGDSLWDRVGLKLYDRSQGVYIKNLRQDGTVIDAPDVSQLSPFYFELSRDTETLKRTLGHLRDALWNPQVGGVNRFRDFEVVDDWHWYTGGTGASWPLFTLWMARFYLLLGDDSEANECLQFVRSASTEGMDIPEKVAPKSGYDNWREHETEYNERVVGGIRRAEASSVSIPGYVAWACPLGWSHAEYLLLGKTSHSSDRGQVVSRQDETALNV